MATRANLRIAHERQQEKALWEEEFGSWRRREDESAASYPRRGRCINGGGKETLLKDH
ncbi:MAG: hypothetical protein LUQ20_08010 [Candidatus Methanoperedens sp.]|nr:hypothetical protein [Candidatus Methanoperedens sp.]